MKINPQKIYPKKEKDVKSHYRKVNGKLVRVNEFRRKYPHKPKEPNKEKEVKKDEGNFVNNKKDAIEDLKCALK